MPAATARRSRPGPSQGAVVVTSQKALGDVEALMTQKRSQLLDLFGGDEAMVDRMRTLTLHALATPKLLEKLKKADMATVIEAVRTCASLGLMPIPALAEGYFVPYWNKDKALYDIQFQAGYGGLAKLVRRSGLVTDVDAGVAYENDLFEYEEGSAPFVRHVRALKDRGNRIAAYAIAWLPGGLTKVRILDMAEIEKVRKSSKAGDDSPWVHWFDQMAMKTALRRLTSYLPKSPQVEQALAGENDAETRYALPPVRKAPPAISAIHARLGIAPPDDEETVESEAVEGEVVIVDEFHETTDAQLRTVICGAPSPLTEGATCDLTAGHEGVHRVGDSETFPQTAKA